MPLAPTWAANAVEACRNAVVSYPIQPEICAQALDVLKASPDLALGPIVEATGLLAIGYARTSRATQAREVMDQLLQEQPDSWLAHANHGTVLLYLGQFGQSLAATDRAITLSQARNLAIPDLYLNRALAARGRGEYGNAEEAFAIYRQLMGQVAEPRPVVPDAHGPAELSRPLYRRFGDDPFEASGRVQSR